MDFRLLRMFRAVAKHGSVVAAAREVHLTASALSHGIKALETQLGIRLFERRAKKLVLNHAGEQLLAQVNEPLEALAAAEESIKRLGKWGQTRLRIGAAASACQYILPPVIRELKALHPKLLLQVELGDMSEMVERLRSHQVDLALGLAPENTTDLESRPMFRDELLFVFSPTHPWSRADSVSTEDLRKQPLILYQRHSYTAQMVEGYFRSLDITPSTVMEIASIEAIKELVKLNVGISVLAPWAADKEIAKGKLRMRPLGNRKLVREWVVAYSRTRRLNYAEESFCRLCRNFTTGLRLDRRDLPPLAVKA